MFRAAPGIISRLTIHASPPSIKIRATHEVMAARAAEFAFLVVQLVAALRTPAPVLAGVLRWCRARVRRRRAVAGFTLRTQGHALVVSRRWQNCKRGCGGALLTSFSRHPSTCWSADGDGSTCRDSFGMTGPKCSCRRPRRTASSPPSTWACRPAPAPLPGSTRGFRAASRPAHP